MTDFQRLIYEKYYYSLYKNSISICLIYGCKKYGMEINHKLTIEDNPDIEVYRNCGYKYSIYDRYFEIGEKEWSKVKADIKSYIRNSKIKDIIDE